MPEIPSFAVDDGFTYSIPEGMDVGVGSKVRVRVSGRRMAGYVTAVFPEPVGRKLLPVDGVSGDAPVFDRDLLAVCRWVAGHYVAPLSTILKRTAPPNAPKTVTHGGVEGPPPTQGERIRYTVGAEPYLAAVANRIDLGHPTMAAGIVAPTAVEVSTLADLLEERFPGRVVMATSSMSGRDVTTAWSRAAHDATTVLVGTREIALWKLAGGGAWTVVEDARRVMKSPSTPTVNVREIMLERWRVTHSAPAFVGPVPSLEVLALDPEVVGRPGRSWPLVDVVDRTQEPPGSPLLTSRARSSIVKATKAGKRVFLLVSARGYAPAFRCTHCATLRKCAVCETTASMSDACRRCGAELGPCRHCGRAEFAPLGAGIGRIVDEVASFAGRSTVGDASAARLVTVGSERDLVGLGEVGLGVVVDVDGMAGAPHYRAAEDSLRLCVRLAHHVAGWEGSRLLVQTSAPDQPVTTALVSGKAGPFLRAELSKRWAAGFPPVGELIAIEVASDSGADADSALRSAVSADATLLGPASMKDRKRWLIQGTDLSATRLALRECVGALRTQGAKVRVDVDPIDL